MKTRNPSATTVRKGLGFTSWGYCLKLRPKIALVLATEQRSTRSTRGLGTQPALTHRAQSGVTTHQGQARRPGGQPHRGT